MPKQTDEFNQIFSMHEKIWEEMKLYTVGCAKWSALSKDYLDLLKTALQLEKEGKRWSEPPEDQPIIKIKLEIGNKDVQDMDMDELISNASAEEIHQYLMAIGKEESFEREDEFEPKKLKPKNIFIEEIKRRENK